jgi:hypothetical protein
VNVTEKFILIIVTIACLSLCLFMAGLYRECQHVPFCHI